MSKSPFYVQPPSNLSVGNIVSAGLRIYRDRFQTYYGLALKSSLWFIVPSCSWVFSLYTQSPLLSVASLILTIYCCARGLAILGLISRLAFGEVSESPESVTDARSYVYKRKWSFFWATILVGLILFVVYIVVAFIVGILLAIFLPTFIRQGSPPSLVFIITIVIPVLLGIIWIWSRLSVYTLPIAIEDNSTASGAINRSWTLTQGYAFRLQLIWLVTVLITFPISIIIDQLLDFTMNYFLRNSNDFSNLGSGQLPVQSLGIIIFRLVIGLPINSFFIPIHQSIQAIIYYDLITRKEGFGLKIRNS
jgi:hypothetical protein